MTQLQKARTQGLGFEGGQYRLNVAALVRVRRRLKSEKETLPLSSSDDFLICARADFEAWQCPQGGLEAHDRSARDAVLRELEEELGIQSTKVRILHESAVWRRYDFGRFQTSKDRAAGRLGQQQKWFVCEVDTLEECDLSKSHGEFSHLGVASIEDLVDMYASWKRAPLLDFCRELGLVSALNAQPGS